MRHEAGRSSRLVELEATLSVCTGRSTSKLLTWSHQFATHNSRAQLFAADEIAERTGRLQDAGKIWKTMVHGQVLGARLAPCCRALARAGALRCRAATPQIVQHRDFGSTPRKLRERVSSRYGHSTVAVNGAESATHPAFADVAFAFEYVH